MNKAVYVNKMDTCLGRYKHVITKMLAIIISKSTKRSEQPRNQDLPNILFLVQFKQSS